MVTARHFFAAILTLLLTTPKLFAQARASDQPADLSGIEEQAAKPNGDDDTPQKVTHTQREEPSPQIRKKNDNFTADFQSGSRYIEHPMAAKGLYLIDKNKTYYYRVKMTESTQETSVRLGPYDPSSLSNPSHPSIKFDNLYDANIPMVLFDTEYDISKKFGRLGWKYGAGLFIAQGSGEFVQDAAKQANPQGPPEGFTFLLLPLNVGAIYHFEWFKNQWVTPYAEGALDAFCFAEMRDDNLNKFGAAFGLASGAHVSAGATVPLGHDSRSFLDLDREYGITKVSFAAEFREYVAFESKWDFTGSVVSAGFSVNY